MKQQIPFLKKLFYALIVLSMAAGYLSPPGAGHAAIIPVAPTNLNATKGAYLDRVNISWNSVSNASYYEIWRATSDTGAKTKVAAIPPTSFDDYGITLGEVYYYWVRACNGPYCSDFSAYATGYSGLTTPAYIYASDGTYTDKVNLTWGYVTSRDHYEIFRHTVNDVSQAAVINDTVTATTYDDTTAIPGVKYFYWVRACTISSCGDFTAPNAGHRGIAAPNFVDASDGVYTDKVHMTWEPVAGKDYYKVYRHTADDLTQAALLSSNITAESYDDPTTVPGTAYYYWVRGCSVYTCGLFSASEIGFSQLLPPSYLVASDGAYTDKVSLSWGYVSGQEYYEIYRHTANDLSQATMINNTVTTLNFDDTSAVPGILYNYWVRACNSLGCSEFSPRNVGHRIILAPAGLNASDGTNTSHVSLTWDAVEGATKYKVYRNTENVSAGIALLDGNVLSSKYQDNGTVPGKSYYYWVIACSNACSALNSSDSGYRGFPVVSAVSASDHTFSDKISVTWQTDITYDRYEVYRHTSDNSASAALLDGNVLLTGYEDISVVAGKKYFYWVKACNTYGCSGFSASDFGISDLPAPTNLTASDGTHIDKIELSWNPVTNAETYRVFRHTSSDFSLATLLQTDITGTRYADTSAEAGTTYYYWVQACGDFCGKVSATDTGSLANPSISLPFSDGFETGDLSKWSNVYNGNEKLPACNLCVQQSASLKGKFGLAVNILDKQSHFLEDFSPENENRYHARFYIDVSGLQMPNGSNLNIFEGRSGQKKVFSLQLRHYNKKFWVRGLISSNTGKIFQTGWTVVPNGPTAIEIDWNSTRSQFKQDGFIKLWVNGELRQKKTGVANSTLSLDEVLLGITSPIEAAYNISGSFYLDDFISNNLNYIGP